MKKFTLHLTAVATLTVALASQALAATHTNTRSVSTTRTSSYRGVTTTSRNVQATSYRGYTNTARVTNYSANSYARPAVTNVSRNNYANAYRSNYSINRSNYTGNRGNYTNYHLTYGTRFAQGYFYRGRSHSHWTYTRFDSRYGCTCYYDPCCSCWYYWCEPATCYYPVAYCPYQTYAWSAPVAETVGYAAPVAVQSPTPVAVQPPTAYQPVTPSPLPSPRGGDAPPREYGVGPLTTALNPNPLPPATDE